VSNKNSRDLLLRGEKQDFILQGLSSERIKRAERLVHQQDLWRLREATRDLHALLHPARQLRGVLLFGMGEAHAYEELIDDRSLRLARDAARLEPECDIGMHRAPGQQRLGIILKHNGAIA
jgi:hypothetical protein